jgi:WD40 repeat protein
MRIWDTGTGEELLALRGHKDLVGRVLFDERGWRLASASEDGTVRIWDGTPFDESFDPHVHALRTDAGVVNSVAFSRDSRWLAAGGGEAGQPGEVKLTNVASGRSVLPLRGHTDRVFGVAFGPESLLATAGADGTVRFWDTRTGRESRPPLMGVHGASIYGMALDPAGHRILTCNAYHAVQLWDLTTGKHQILKGHRGFVDSVVLSPDGKLAASAGVDGTVRIWDAVAGMEVGPPFGQHRTRVYNAVFSPGGEMVASGDSAGNVLVWEVASRSVRHTLEGDGDYVLGLAFSPDGKYLAAASWKEVKLHDLRNTAETYWTLGGLAGTISGLAFSPDGQYLAACGGYKNNGEIKIWDRTAWYRGADQ